MSFSDRSWLTGWQKLGCGLYLVIGSIVVAYFTIEGMFPNSDEPDPPMWLSLLYFPGAAIAAAVLGGLLLWYFARDKD